MACATKIAHVDKYYQRDPGSMNKWQYFYWSNRRQIKPWYFLAPVILALAVIAGWPLGRTLYFAFTDTQLSYIQDGMWVGLSNFEELFSDPLWWGSVRNTLAFTIISVSLEVAIGLIIAMALNQHFKGRGLLRAAILVPWAIPTIVSAKMWGWMYHDVYGIINELLLNSGFIDSAIPWTAGGTLSMVSVIIADVWKTTPFMALLLLAGLQVIPHEIYEAAKLDGVHPVKVFFRITLPLLKPALIVAVIFRCLDAMRVFDLIFILTSNMPETMSISVYSRQQLIDFQNVGMGSAAAACLFLIIAACAAIYFVLSKGRVQDA